MGAIWPPPPLRSYPYDEMITSLLNENGDPGRQLTRIHIIRHVRDAAELDLKSAYHIVNDYCVRRRPDLMKRSASAVILVCGIILLAIAVPFSEILGLNDARIALVIITIIIAFTARWHMRRKRRIAVLADVMMLLGMAALLLCGPLAASWIRAGHDASEVRQRVAAVEAAVFASLGIIIAGGMLAIYDGFKETRRGR